jgi:pyrimidine deaminase RibD-like protein
MHETTSVVLVTIDGECFEAEFERREVDSNRDGSLYLFRLRDLRRGRGERLVQLFRSGQLKKSIADYDAIVEMVRLNAIRRAFDAGFLSFDKMYDPEAYAELKLTASDFKPGRTASEAEIRRYLEHKAYWIGWRHNPEPGRYRVRFDTDEDLDYLGVQRKDVRRHFLLLVEQGLLHPSDAPGTGRPSAKLIAQHDSDQPIETGNQQADDRKFAKMAVEEARQSVPEDARIHPKVGAIVVKDGRVIGKAHRGESAEGHAEFTVLEKKLADVPLSGATVYTTLEPCTTRNHPKIPCAERLIERKVARVVIGMLDPDGRITGRGQRRLRGANIITDFFPHDLMMEVEELNRDFTRFCERQENTQTARSVSQAARDIHLDFWLEESQEYISDMMRVLEVHVVNLSKDTVVVEGHVVKFKDEHFMEGRTVIRAGEVACLGFPMGHLAGRSGEIPVGVKLLYASTGIEGETPYKFFTIHITRNSELTGVSEGMRRHMLHSIKISNGGPEATEEEVS